MIFTPQSSQKFSKQLLYISGVTSGHINPADDATRGIPIADLNENCRWFTGPSFLMKTPGNWPVDILQTSSQPAVSDKSINGVSCRAQLTQAIDFPINFKFSSWCHVVRITAFVHRAVRIFRKSVENSISHLTTAVPHSCRIHQRKDQTSTGFTNAKFFPGTFRHSVRTTTANQQLHQNINALHLSEWNPPCPWSLGEVPTLP